MTLAAVALLTNAVFAAPPEVAAGSEPQLGAAVYWFGGYPAPRIPMVGDADGDGLADFIGFYPPDGGIVDFVGTSPLGKPHDNVQARRPFAGDARAVVCALFSGAGQAEVLAVLPDGALRVAWAMNADSHCFDREEAAGGLLPGQLPAEPLQAVAGDVNGDGRPDVVVVGADGDLLLLLTTWPRGEGRRFTGHAVGEGLGPVSRVAMGTLGSDERAALVWLAEDGGRGGVSPQTAGLSRQPRCLPLGPALWRDDPRRPHLRPLLGDCLTKQAVSSTGTSWRLTPRPAGSSADTCSELKVQTTAVTATSRPACHRTYAIREGDWKLTWNDRSGPQTVRLFDLPEDPGEWSDLAAAHPERAQAMQDLFDAWDSGLAGSQSGRAPGEWRNPAPIPTTGQGPISTALRADCARSASDRAISADALRYRSRASARRPCSARISASIL